MNDLLGQGPSLVTTPNIDDRRNRINIHKQEGVHKEVENFIWRRLVNGVNIPL